MITIPIYHLMLYNGVFYLKNSSNAILGLILSAGGAIPADYAFIALSTYFLIGKKESSTDHLKRILRFVVILLCCYLIKVLVLRGLFGYGNTDYFIDLFLMKGAWWFAYPYLVLLILYPLLNKMIASVKDAGLYCITLGLACIFLLAGWLNTENFWFDLSGFLLVYSLLALIKRKSGGRNQRGRVGILLFGVLLLYFIMLGICLFAKLSPSIGFSDRNDIIQHIIGRYSFPAMLMGLLEFYLFKNIKISFNFKINSLAKSTVFVFLLHDTVMGVFWYFGRCCNDFAYYTVTDFILWILIYLVACFAIAGLLATLMSHFVFPHTEKLICMLTENSKENENVYSTRANGAADIAKIIMAVLVVAIHVRPFEGTTAFIYDDILARVANPLFFMLAAYFLFRKMYAGNEMVRWKNYMLHLIKLYAILVLINLPGIVKNIRAIADTPLQFALIFLKRILLQGPYGALWFLTALLLAMTLTFFLWKKCGPLVTLLISAPFFLFTVVETEYARLVMNIHWMNMLNDLFMKVFGWLANGLTYGFFFTSLGMVFAWLEWKRTKEDRPDCTMKVSQYWLGLILSLAALFTECFLIRAYDLNMSENSYGAMLMLIPVSCFLLLLILKSHLEYHPIYRNFRQVSVIIFGIHFIIWQALLVLWQDQEWFIGDTTLQYKYVLFLSFGLAEGYLLLKNLTLKKLGKSRK